MCPIGNTPFEEYTGSCTLSEIITERDVNDEDFRVARRPDGRTPDLDSARHENVRPIL